jgi:drug/metabolite transporter (DMT)-like permease
MNRPLILSVGFMDNMAWIFYAYSMLSIPVAIATGISESYIVLASLLGLWLNRERLRHHQFVGLLVAVIGAILLAMTLE